MGKIIDKKRSIIPACDVENLETYEKILEATHDIGKIGGYKIGISLGLTYGLPKVVKLTRKYSDKPIIFDLQKAGNDIPDTGKIFARVCKEAEIDAVILFPFSSPITAYEWIRDAQKEGLGVIVGARMTNPRQLEGDYSNPKDKDYSKIFKELGFEEDLDGFIRRDAPEKIYRLAARLGITDFVVPGNRPKEAESIIQLLKEECDELAIYSPGLIAQGGDLTEGGELAEKFKIEWHAIVGRALYRAKDIRKAALELVSKI
jgi:orotidine-5'-phosphate decarboxylase